MSPPNTAVRAAALARPVWRASRLWLLLGAIVLAGAVIVAALGTSPSAPLDPASSTHGGSKALAVLLQSRGTQVHSTTSIEAAAGAPAAATVLVAFPDELSAEQLTRLAAGGRRLVLVEPGPASLTAVAPDRDHDSSSSDDPVAPGCTWPGAQAAGPVRFPAPTWTFTGPGGCYGGAIVVTDRLVLIGAGALLRNDRLATGNVAALDLNAISADGAVSEVRWLLPGAEDGGGGSPSIWTLFPRWAQHAFWWLLVVGLLLVLWRGRRLGPVVTEPLPVIVRSAEIVEGHGRLYRRAAARERSAAILRAATIHRLARRLGLDRRAPASEVIAVAAAAGGDGPRLRSVLGGSAPVDDRALLELARDLAAIDAQPPDSRNVPRVLPVRPVRPVPKDQIP